MKTGERNLEPGPQPETGPRSSDVCSSNSNFRMGQRPSEAVNALELNTCVRTLFMNLHKMCVM